MGRLPLCNFDIKQTIYLYHFPILSSFLFIYTIIHSVIHLNKYLFYLIISSLVMSLFLVSLQADSTLGSGRPSDLPCLVFLGVVVPLFQGVRTGVGVGGAG